MEGRKKLKFSLFFFHCSSLPFFLCEIKSNLDELLIIFADACEFVDMIAMLDFMLL